PPPAGDGRRPPRRHPLDARHLRHRGRRPGAARRLACAGHAAAAPVPGPRPETWPRATLSPDQVPRHGRTGLVRMRLVAELGAASRDVLLELPAERVVHRRLLVLLDRLLPDLARARGGIAAAVAVPPLVVLGRREQWPVEA